MLMTKDKYAGFVELLWYTMMLQMKLCSELDSNVRRLMITTQQLTAKVCDIAAGCYKSACIASCSTSAHERFPRHKRSRGFKAK